MLEDSCEKVVNADGTIIYFCRTGKRCYSKQGAGEVIRLAKKRNNCKNKIPVRSYYCKECGAYHTTSRKREWDGKEKIKNKKGSRKYEKYYDY